MSQLEEIQEESGREGLTAAVALDSLGDWDRTHDCAHTGS